LYPLSLMLTAGARPHGICPRSSVGRPGSRRQLQRPRVCIELFENNIKILIFSLDRSTLL
ncbi:MAG: hypothetical protein K7J15_04680, partial [Candidatus Regiella insecticola]|nr:hypothetical protein [Candidatus Regiella insecticola]